MIAILRWVVPLMLLLLNGCNETASVASSNTTISGRQDNVLLSKPAWVLDGTDLLPIEEVNRADVPPIMAGYYRSEHGGSEITVSLTTVADGAWKVKRVYREPDLPPQVKQYRTERKGQVLITPGKDVIIQGTQEGVLMLELASGVDSIPADFWIHYIRAE